MRPQRRVAAAIALTLSLALAACQTVPQAPQAASDATWTSRYLYQSYAARRALY